MKLTDAVRKEIDAMSPGRLWAQFRFFPWGEYRGEAGEYLKERLRETRKGARMEKGK